jgi:hypothetical protein
VRCSPSPAMPERPARTTAAAAAAGGGEIMGRIGGSASRGTLALMVALLLLTPPIRTNVSFLHLTSLLG